MITQLYPKKKKIQVWLRLQIAKYRDDLIRKLGGKPKSEISKLLTTFEQSKEKQVKAEVDRYIASAQPLISRITEFYANPAISEEIMQEVVEIRFNVDKFLFHELRGPDDVDLLCKFIIPYLHRDLRQVGLAGLTQRGMDRFHHRLNYRG